MKLPLNCEAEYISDFLSPYESDNLYKTLINDYQLDQARLKLEAAGKLFQTDSFKILFCTERLQKLNTHPEEIHGKSYLWTGVMAELRDKVENLLNKEFELAMCLYYPNGEFFAPYHSDQETSGHNTILPSLSLGEVRDFCFKNIKNEETYKLELDHGSLLVMGDYCQTRYMHSLVQDSRYKNGRINITFREPGFK